VACGQTHNECPPPAEQVEDGVALATLVVDRSGIVAVEDLSARRQLPSMETVRGFMRCQCPERPPGAIRRIEPDSVILGYGGTIVVPRAVITGNQLDGASAVAFAGGGISAQVLNSTSGAALVRLLVSRYAAPSARAFAVLFPDGRPPLVSTDFGVVFWIREAYGYGWDTGIGGDLL
jgi:hypothetical protein